MKTKSKLKRMLTLMQKPKAYRDEFYRRLLKRQYNNIKLVDVDQDDQNMSSRDMQVQVNQYNAGQIEF
jgi:hypothetical protein